MNPSSGVLCWEFNDNVMLKSTVNPSQCTVCISTVVIKTHNTICLSNVLFLLQ